MSRPNPSHFVNPDFFNVKTVEVIFLYQVEVGQIFRYAEKFWKRLNTQEAIATVTKNNIDADFLSISENPAEIVIVGRKMRLNEIPARPNDDEFNEPRDEAPGDDDENEEPTENSEIPEIIDRDDEKNLDFRGPAYYDPWEEAAYYTENFRT